MIETLLKPLKMSGSLEALSDLNRLKDRDQFVVGLLQAEKNVREQRATKRRLTQAKFPTDKEWCDINPDLNPSIDFTEVQSLTDGDFVNQQLNICMMGHQGTGKTHSLIALGRQLCRKGINTKFYTACELVTLLEEAKASHTLSKLMQSLLKPQLLIIDELGFVPFSENGARLLFDVFATRYEKGSIAVSTNLSFEKWVEVFGSIELTAALIDRFSHKCLIFNFSGESVRFMNAKKNQRTRAPHRAAEG